MGYSGEREENERKKSFRIVGSFFSSMRVPPILWTSTGTASRRGPVYHWCHVQALSAGHGAPLRPGGRRGELKRLSVLVQGLGRTTPVCPTLFLM